MNGLTTHGCGKSWRQRGNRTSHCGGCHVTFEGLSLFDAHFVHHKDGTLTHLDPRTMTFNKAALVFDGTFGDGSWRRSDLPDSAFKASAKPEPPVGADTPPEAVEHENRRVSGAVPR